MSTPKNSLLVRDVMMPLDRVPIIGEKVIFKEALEEMQRMHLGISCIVSSEKKLLGVITDGDIRRMLLRVQKPFSAFFVDDAIQHAVLSPLTIAPSDTLANATRLMGDKRIWDLPVVDDSGNLLGLLHLHPALEALLGTSD